MTDRETLAAAAYAAYFANTPGIEPFGLMDGAWQKVVNAVLDGMRQSERERESLAIVRLATEVVRKGPPRDPTP